MEKKKKLPLGIDNFEKLRQQDFYYVDKTMLIHDLMSGWGEVNLFTRPRRFGKSLNMSMLKSFFEIGSDKSLFDGLAIAEEKELCEKYMGQFPVVFISLKAVDGLTFEEAFARMANVIRDEAERLQYLLDSLELSRFDKMPLNSILDGSADEVTIQGSLKTFTKLLYKHYKRNVILLIDEYDVPLDKAFQNGYYEKMLNLIREMFGASLKTNDSLFFAVLTGCLRISKESIFTGLNNLKVHSTADVAFDEYFGFTKPEVEEMLSYYELGAHGEELKEWYDGYRFGARDVYCPWDVINYCYDLLHSKNAKPKAYWLNTSGNDMVRRLIQKASTGTDQGDIECLIAGESIRKRLNDRLTHNEIDLDINNVWSLLYMTGYLTMKGEPEDDTYELIIPNKEVRKIFIDQILQWFREKARADAVKLTKLYQAFATGDAQTVQDMLNAQLIATISFHDAQESFYHGFLLALLTACEDWRATSNAETGKGRSDILVESVDGGLGFIIEVKDVKDSDKLEAACETALRQIEEKEYIAYFRKYRIKEIWTYGIAFSGKECRVAVKHQS